MIKMRKDALQHCEAFELSDNYRAAQGNQITVLQHARENKVGMSQHRCSNRIGEYVKILHII